MALLEASGITKAFQLNSAPLPVLEDVSFSVEPGEIVVFVGKSGCGKSTLLRILAGLTLPDTGQVRLNGGTVTEPTPEISILFQKYTVFPWMTVRGNVEAGLLSRSIPRDERRRTAEQYLRMVGLQEFAASWPSVLSGGMQQRVALARTYAMHPKILLMDEPFAALDAITRSEMQRELLRMNAEEAKAVVFVTHDIEEAILLGKRIYVLSVRPAKIIKEFQPDSTSDQAVLHQEVARALDQSLSGGDTPRI